MVSTFNTHLFPALPILTSLGYVILFCLVNMAINRSGDLIRPPRREYVQELGVVLYIIRVGIYYATRLVHAFPYSSAMPLHRFNHNIS